MHSRQNRYSPWWMPTAVIVLLVTSVILFALLVFKETTLSQGKSKTVSADGHTVYRWKMVTTWPKRFPGLGLAPENFARLVNELSHGRLVIDVYGANEIVPPLGVFGAVSSGSVEVGHSASQYWKGKLKAAPFFTALPFGMTVQEYNGWLHYGGGLELWRELYAPFNLVPFAGGNTGTQMGGWFNREINNLDDLLSIKMRLPGLGGEVLTKAGGTAVNIPGGEIFTALQSGVIDATEWVGPYNDLTFGFYQVAKYYYYPGWQEPSGAVEFIVNKDVFEALPLDLQKIIEVAARAINGDSLDEYNARNKQALKELIETHNVQVRQYPTEVFSHLEKVAWELYDEMALTDPDFARVLDSYKTYLHDVVKYHKVSEEAYYRMRQAP